MSPCRSGPSDTAHASRGVEEAMGHRVARPAMGFKSKEWNVVGITPEQAQELWEQHQRIWKPRMDAEEAEVRRLGDQIGYGRLMQAAESIWREKAIAQGTPGSEHTTGPCAALMVKCGCHEPDPRREWFSDNEMVHCDWCCGAGRVTARVRRAMSE